jgi:hypothetical protein
MRPYFGGSPFEGGSGSLLSSGVVKFGLLVLVVAGAIFVIQRPIRAWIDSAGDSIEEADDPFRPGATPVDVSDPEDPESPGEGTASFGYSSVRDLVRDLNAGGLVCKDLKVDAEDEYISTGSCQAHVDSSEFPVHVQINIYLQPTSLNAALEIMESSPFTYVAADDWVVVTQPEVARKVRKAIGGRLHVAS